MAWRNKNDIEELHIKLQVFQCNLHRRNLKIQKAFRKTSSRKLVLLGQKKEMKDSGKEWRRYGKQEKMGRTVEIQS